MEEIVNYVDALIEEQVRRNNTFSIMKYGQRTQPMLKFANKDSQIMKNKGKSMLKSTTNAFLQSPEYKGKTATLQL